MQPTGLGTPMVESFTSYITRLAGAHCTTIGVLIAQEISPLLKKKYLDLGRSRKVQSGSMIEIVKSMDGTGQTAFEWTCALEKLTLRTDFHLLTMLPFKNLFSARNLLRNKRVWCPLCFESFKNKQEIVYEPLLWRLRAANFCPIHSIPFQDFCNICKKDKHPILGSGTWAGFCHYCKQWLGHSEAVQGVSEENDQFQISISKSISDVLADSAHLSSSATRQNIIANIETCIKYYSDGNISEFARLMNSSSRIINNWHNGTNLFRLDLLGRICFELNLPLRQFLGGIIKPNMLKERNFNQLTEKGRNKKTINLVAMKELLESALHKKLNVPSLRQLAENFGSDSSCFKRHFPELCKKLKSHCSKYKVTEQEKFFIKIKSALNEYPPPSVATLSRRVNRCIPTLYKSFPKLCREITAKHKAYKESIRKGEILAITEEIRQIALKLHRAGIYPSQKSVGQLMTHPGRMANEPARAILRKIQQTLSI